MRPEEEIDRLAKAVLQEAREEAEQIKSEAQAKADDIRKRAQSQAEAERKIILDKAQEDVNRLRGQSVASAQLNARTLQLEHREKILNKVFDAARQKLSNASSRSDFDKIADSLLREALTQLQSAAADVHVDDATQKALKVDAVSSDLHVQITLGEPLKSGTGVVVDAGGGKLHYDNTLDVRLNRLQDSLRSSVYHVLNGERL